jgi:gas vesicle protein
MKAEEWNLERNQTSTTALWFLGGAALGAAVTALLATESGKRTRGKLALQAKRGKDVLSESSQEIVDKGRELYERGRELAEEAADMFERGRRIAEKKVNDYV